MSYIADEWEIPHSRQLSERERLIQQIKRMERLSMIEWVRRHTPALAESKSCYRFFEDEDS